MEYSELNSHGHTKAATTYRPTVSEDDLKMSRKALSQLKILRKSHFEMDRRSGTKSGWDPLPGIVTHKLQGYHRNRGSLK